MSGQSDQSSLFDLSGLPDLSSDDARRFRLQLLYAYVTEDVMWNAARNKGGQRYIIDHDHST